MGKVDAVASKQQADTSQTKNYRTDKYNVAAGVKVEPYSLEAEQAVLGALMTRPDLFDDIFEIIKEADFYRNDHQLIYAAIVKLINDSKPCDKLIIEEVLASGGSLQQAGGSGYLGMLTDNLATVANAKAYAEIVREKSVLRQLIKVGTDIAANAYNYRGDGIEQLLDTAETKVMKIADDSSSAIAPYRSISELLVNVTDNLAELAKSGSSVVGLRTGFTEFDKLTTGLQKSDLIIVAARPSMGKTAFAMNIVENVAMGEKLPVAVFSMEMSAEQLATRIISSTGRVNQQNLRVGNLHDRDWTRITSAMSLMGNAKIFIDDTPALSPFELRARARRIKREHGLSLIVVDYLQLMHVPGSENRVNEISHISRSLKALAKELEIPVVALSQLSRGLESRNDKRPLMSDLRESGAIEQDADVVTFIYRDEYYNKNKADNKNVAEIIIGKQRNGPTDTVRLAFLGEYTKFENLSEQLYSSDGHPL